MAKKSVGKKKTAKKAGVKPTGTLTGARRKRVASSDFGIPPKRKAGKRLISTGKYPMPDKSHAANAKARAKQSLDAGKLSKAEYSKIVRMADKKLYGSTKKTAKKATKKGRK